MSLTPAQERWQIQKMLQRPSQRAALDRTCRAPLAVARIGFSAIGEVIECGAVSPS
jgi:hypothetical protein